MNEEKELIQHGYAGHFMMCRDCQFHLTTEVGDFVVSTIGDYCPDGELTNRVEIIKGYNFQTKVFQFMGYSCSDICLYVTRTPLNLNYSNAIETKNYNTAGEAQEGHRKLCQIYLKI